MKQQTGWDAYWIRGNVVTEHEVRENQVLEVRDGRIQGFHATPPPGIPEYPTPGGWVLLPGFRDPHTHDLLGQLAAPSHTDEENMERMGRIAQAYARRGVTGVYVATFGAAIDDLLAYCRGARMWMDRPENGRQGAKVLGINIEGSFINEACRGAQPAEHCFMPHRWNCLELIDRLWETGAVRLVNIVPDFGLPSLETIQHARVKGLHVGAGHLKPEADLLQTAFEQYGLEYMVHFTNGPTGQSFKPFGGGGAFEGAMNLPIVKELVLDLIHVDPRYVLDIIRRTEERWGLDKVIAVTDASFPLEAEIPEEAFQVGSTIAKKDESLHCLRTVAYVQPDGTRQPAPHHTLCGSLLTMDQAFTNLLRLFTREREGHWYFHPAHTLEQAMIKSAQLCATNQSRLDWTYMDTGSLEVGKAADFVAGVIEEGAEGYRFHVRRT
ncbi:MAG: hypothetical protein A3G75_14545, partial [Verrucomicrobia bacterium RIFCSPLOWO2_12_FULL_64_8]